MNPKCLLHIPLPIYGKIFGILTTFITSISYARLYLIKKSLLHKLLAREGFRVHKYALFATMKLKPWNIYFKNLILLNRVGSRFHKGYSIDSSGQKQFFNYLNHQTSSIEPLSEGNMFSKKFGQLSQSFSTGKI